MSRMQGEGVWPDMGMPEATRTTVPPLRDGGRSFAVPSAGDGAAETPPAAGAIETQPVSRGLSGASGEGERLDAIERLGLGAAVDGPALDSLVASFRLILDVPIASIAIAHRETLALKPGHGITACFVTPRRGTFCDEVVESGEALTVTDAGGDPRFAASPWVIGPLGFFRFYVGLPLRTSTGHVLGTLCGFDTRTREPPPAEALAALEHLAATAISALELQASESALRQKKEALSRRTELLQATIENVTQGITAFDENLRLVTFNTNVLDILDFPPERCRNGMDLHEAALIMAERGLYGEGAPEELARARAETARTFAPFDLERELWNGRTVRLRGVPLPTGGFLTTYTDLTEERRRSDDLIYQAKFQKWQGFVGMVANEAADIASAFQRYLEFSCENLGYAFAHVSRQTSEGLVSTGLLHVRPGVDLVAPSPDVLISRVVQASGVAKDAFEACGEVVIEAGDLDLGDLGAVSGFAVGEDVAAGLGFAISILSDIYVIEWYGPYAITHKPAQAALVAHLQSQLSRVAERERVERLKTEFVSTVSHELETPLASIRMIVDRLRSQPLSGLSDEVAGMLQIASADTDRLRQLIQDILTLHRLDNGLLPLDLAAHDAPALVRQAIRVGGERAPVTLRQERDDLVAVVDRAYFTQILTNLLSNAVKFSPPDGSIDVSIGTRCGWIRTSVADRGPGIPEDFRPYVFDRFAQADGSDRRKIAGTGLGLAIARRLTDKLGGRLNFESIVGEGTVFHLDLPAAPSVSCLA